MVTRFQSVTILLLMCIQCYPPISTSTGYKFLCLYTEMSIYRNNGKVRNKYGIQHYFINSAEIYQ